MADDLTTQCVKYPYENRQDHHFPSGKGIVTIAITRAQHNKLTLKRQGKASSSDELCLLPKLHRNYAIQGQIA